MTPMTDLAGKTGLIVGIANKRSIAWAIAQAASAAGARLAVTYQGERLEENVRELSEALTDPLILPCDVTDDAQIAAVFSEIAREFGGLDFVVHGAAFAPREELAGGFVDSATRQGFLVAHDISSYSLTALAKAGRPLMKGRNGALITLSYLGAVRSIPSYNVMGLAKASLEANVRFLAADLGPENIRVNAISAGPIKTLAAAGIGGFRKMLGHVAAVNPLRRNVTQEEVGNAAAFLCSDLASGITGEVVYVDAGYSHVGMTFAE